MPALPLVPVLMFVCLNATPLDQCDGNSAVDVVAREASPTMCAMRGKIQLVSRDGEPDVERYGRVVCVPTVVPGEPVEGT